MTSELLLRCVSERVKNLNQDKPNRTGTSGILKAVANWNWLHEETEPILRIRSF